MRIVLRARDVMVTPLLRAHVGRRLGLALGRFGERIDKVTVQLMMIAPPGRGVAVKRCRIDVGLRPRPVVVEDADTNLLVALDRATDRIARSVARALEREQALEQNSQATTPRLASDTSAAKPSGKRARRLPKAAKIVLKPAAKLAIKRPSRRAPRR
jgi:ribosomal subunit interface protein